MEELNIATQLQKIEIFNNKYYSHKINSFLKLFYKSYNLPIILYSTSHKKIIYSYGVEKQKKLLKLNKKIHNSYRKNLGYLIKSVRYKNSFQIFEDEFGYFRAAIPIKNYNIIILLGQIFFDPLEPADFNEFLEKKKEGCLLLVDILENIQSTNYSKLESILEFISYAFISQLDLLSENYLLSDIGENSAKPTFELQNRYEQLLQKNNDVFQYNSLPMLKIDAQNEISINHEFSKVTGFKQNEIRKNSKFLDQLFSERELLNTIQKRIEENNYINNIETQVNSKSGKSIDVLLNVERYKLDDKKSYTNITLIDRTKSKSIQKKLDFYNTINTGILKNSNEFILIIDKFLNVTLLSESYKQFLKNYFDISYYKWFTELIPFIDDDVAERLESFLVTTEVNSLETKFSHNEKQINLRIKVVPINIEREIAYHLFMFEILED
ncbi:MAG: PAS domain S-box protein [Candidatus Cloacimonadota bacterium]|nr:PAS domain S-box protein [Candidatus Cloacimonadota bacterium]